MPPRISLALAIHNHQPVGNLGWVYTEVFDRAYGPMLDALERHPTVRLALHYSGALLEWLRSERPEFLGRLVDAVDRRQVELLGGGYFEPVLASLPERDRVGQLRRMADELERLTGRRPRGAWLAERVWEPSLPTSLVAAGYEWTILDDAHFRAASIPDENLWGAYSTEDQGHRVTVFGTEQGLRYLIPFHEVDEAIDHLREHATDDGTRLGVMGDDGEKFGAWPTTFEHSWGAGRWVDRFFEALEANAGWLTTVTPSDWLDRERPIGRVYLPTSSYAEMGEWALPPEEAAAFGPLLHRAIEEHRPEARWLRGGFWRNFQVRYREINDLHKQMLRVSTKVDAMPEGRDRDRALDHLYRGQSNDCYWHGLFGGIYISHMRLATFEHLIAAEDLADAASSHARIADTDLDGQPDVLFEHPGQVVVVDLDEGGGIGSWDIRPVRHALAAVLRRRPEAYHAKLLAQRQAASSPASSGGAGVGGAGVASIHEIVRAKEANLAERIRYDMHERRSGLVRFLDPSATPESFAGAEARELGDFVDRPFEVVSLQDHAVALGREGSVQTAAGPATVRVGKVLRLGGGRLDPNLALDVSVENRSRAVIEARFGIEWAVTMLGGGGNPAAWWELGQDRRRHDSVGQASDVGSIAQGNDDVGIRLDMAAVPAADVWWLPIETVSNSESGFERVYQGSCLLLSWPIRLGPGERREFRVDAAVVASKDRAADEAIAAAAPA